MPDKLWPHRFQLNPSNYTWVHSPPGCVLDFLFCLLSTIRFPKTPFYFSVSFYSFAMPLTPTIEIQYSLEGLMLKLKLQYFGHLMWRADSFEKTLMLGKIEGRRRRGQQRWDGWMASPTRWTWVWASSGSWWWTGRPGVLQSMGSQRVRHDWATELNWAELN